MDVRHTAMMSWQNGMDVVANMTPAFRDNLGPVEKVNATYSKYNQKTLVNDHSTTFRGDLIDLKAGYADLTDAYHDSVEECLFLAGDCNLTGEGDFAAGDYFWRPPGFVHSASSVQGFKGLLFLQGISHGDRSGPTSRVIRPAEEAGTNVLIADMEQAVGPRGWVRVSTKYLPWIHGTDYARTQHQLEGFDTDNLSVKVLSYNAHTGAQSILLRLAPGYAQTSSARHTAELCGFVLGGSVRMADHTLDEESWIRLEPGELTSAWTTSEGATLFVKVDGFLDRLTAQ